jgi:protein-disulfide isomerase
MTTFARTFRPIRASIMAAALAAGAVAAPALAEDALTEGQTEQINKLIEQYILDNPEVIVRAVRELRERQEAADREQAQQNLVMLRDQILNDPATPVAGNPDGDVTVVEFFDYRCGYCKSSLSAVRTAIQEDENLRVVFKEFPILSDESVVASRAALAAKYQGRYFEFHNALMSARGSFTDDQIMEIAGEVGLDIDQLKQDMERPEIADAIAANAELARKLDINGTPAFIVGDQLYPGAVDLEGLLDLVARARAS